MIEIPGIFEPNRSVSIFFKFLENLSLIKTMVEANPAAAGNYEVPFTYRKYFNTEQITEMINAFKGYDTNSNGSIDAAEFKNALHGMGHGDVTDEKVQEMLSRVDKNTDGVIDWIEFLDMMQMVK